MLLEFSFCFIYMRFCNRKGPLNDINPFEALRKLSSSSLDWELLEILLAGLIFRRSTTSVGIRAWSLRRSMDCGRSAVDDDRSRKTRLAVDDDRRQGRWVVDDARSRISFYQAQSKKSLDQVDRNLDRICETLQSIRRMRMSSAIIPRHSSSSIPSPASRRRHPSRHTPTIADDYAPLELPLKWRDSPPLPPTSLRPQQTENPLGSRECAPGVKLDLFRSDLLASAINPQPVACCVHGEPAAFSALHTTGSCPPMRGPSTRPRKTLPAAPTPFSPSVLHTSCVQTDLKRPDKTNYVPPFASDSKCRFEDDMEQSETHIVSNVDMNDDEGSSSDLLDRETDADSTTAQLIGTRLVRQYSIPLDSQIPDPTHTADTSIPSDHSSSITGVNGFAEDIQDPAYPECTELPHSRIYSYQTSISSDYSDAIFLEGNIGVESPHLSSRDFAPPTLLSLSDPTTSDDANMEDGFAPLPATGTTAGELPNSVDIRIHVPKPPPRPPDQTDSVVYPTPPPAHVRSDPGCSREKDDDPTFEVTSRRTHTWIAPLNSNVDWCCEVHLQLVCRAYTRAGSVQRSDRYVERSRRKKLNEYPVWIQHFYLPVEHHAADVVFLVKDSDIVGTQLIGSVSIPAEWIYSSKKVEGVYPILGSNGKPCKPGATLKLSIQYVSIEKQGMYYQGVGLGADYGGVPGTFFPLRKGGKVTLYQDAHITDGCLPDLMLDQGGHYEHGKCWRDIFEAIRQAWRLIYITGWSVFHTVKLVRDAGFGTDCTLGDLLKSKSQEGVRVLLLVWDYPTLRSILGYQIDGVMSTHDEETR
ncbi:uncharacterized protein LOC110092324 [Dendrobium catenatum]|uniref:uncharacterized protein LOC110092324 n=1 Tax=Dendrobium catenatum TaxID=906689 RepID=UPI00109F623B|nr:uncharacterized protein LOC110092324 [Dendrobium catenatum]